MNQFVEIKIISTEKQSEEYRAANDLRNLLIESLPVEARGKIIIQTNATLFGQEVKDIDLILLGSLVNCVVPIMINNSIEHVKVYNFCIVIELKKHPGTSVIRQGTEIIVKYAREDHSVTVQSNKQKYALKRFFETIRNYSPYIFNLIWLKSMTGFEVKTLLTEGLGNVKSNILSADCTFSDLIQLISEQSKLRKKKDGSLFISGFDNFECGVDEWTEILNTFEQVRSCVGDLTRKKIEYISKSLLNKQDSVGNDLTIYRGRAGTGKTIHLLRTAFDIAANRDKRALILTYNHALASDIKRLLVFADLPEDYDKSALEIMTVHQFFYRLLRGIGTLGKDDDFLEKYEELLLETLQYLDENIIDGNEIKSVLRRDYENLLWDFVLVDEGQDWNSVERDILCKIYGPQHIVVADGVGQLVRRDKACDWMRIDSKVQVIKQKKSMRQKENLVSFVNGFAKEYGMDYFQISSAKEMVGGKIIISTLDYLKSNIHQTESLLARQNGNENYDYLFIVPPRLVNKSEKNSEVRCFSMVDQYEKNGIDIWDGTRLDLRTEYPINIEQFRLVQYDSCRGLEGWTVVCLEFDEFLKYKAAMYQDGSVCDELRLETPGEKRNRYIFNWALIPLTRAIDTLIITLRDPASEVGLKLRSLAEQNPDYIEWV